MFSPRTRVLSFSHVPAWHWLVLVLAMTCGVAAAEPAPSPRSIRVVLDENYPPYAFYGADGRLEGLAIDSWRQWEKKTGIQVELTGMDWSHAMKRMDAGEFDVIDTILKTESRAARLAFSEPYGAVPVTIFFAKELTGITTLDSLRGRSVGVRQDDPIVEQLRAQSITLVPFRDYASLIAAVRQHRVQVFIADEPPATYFLRKAGIVDDYEKSAPVVAGAFHRAVLKSNAALLRTIEAGFAAVSPAERDATLQKWLGAPAVASHRLEFFAYGAATALALIAALFGWNRALRRVVAQRTAALRESEARFRQVVENLDDVFWIRDVATRQLAYVSPAYRRVWGRSGVAMAEVQDSWFETVHPDDRVRVRGLAGAGGAYDALFRIEHPQRGLRWIRDRAFEVKNERGDVTRVVGIASDVTEYKQFEQQVLRVQRMEAIGSLSSGIAHDLNNILAPILLSAGLLKTSLADSHQRDLVAIIERSADRGADVLRQLLIYSRGADGQRLPVAVDNLLREMASIVRETFPRSITLQIECASPSAAIVADPTQLHQVLLNLCVNARDAMSEGGTLTLRASQTRLSQADLQAEPQAHPGDYVSLEVGDTGAGIPAGTLDRIFEPFFTTKEVGKGTGLGLSTVLGIVRSHGGFVTVRSEPARGSLFRVYLPAATGAAVEKARASNPPFLRGDGELIIVADDEEAVRSATMRVLERHGYRVLGASDGGAALALVREHRGATRLLLTDIMMPVMGGVALAEAVRKLAPDIRIVATTGLQQADTRIELARLGVTELLLKPTSATDVLAAIRRALQ